MNVKNLGKLSYVARTTFKPTMNNRFKLFNGIGQQNFRSLSGIPKRSIGVLPPSIVPEPANGVPVHVKAYFVAKGIDIMRLAGKLYPSAKQNFQNKCVTIQINENLNQHISVFSYGSVVFYNIPEEDHSNHIRMIKTMSILPISEILQFNESYKLLIHENLEEPSVIHAEHLNIRELDNSNITIVSAVMSQTVAMDWYAANVDNTIERFTIMNMNVQESGAFKNLKETELFKIVASNNSVFTNVLSKLGFFEGNEVAWESAEYYSTWEGTYCTTITITTSLYIYITMLYLLCVMVYILYVI